MIKISKPLVQKALIAGFFSAFTIGVLTVLTYKSTLGYFIAASFGSSIETKSSIFSNLLDEYLKTLYLEFIKLF